MNAFVTTGLMEWIDLSGEMLNMVLGLVHGLVLSIGSVLSAWIRVHDRSAMFFTFDDL